MKINKILSLAVSLLICKATIAQPLQNNEKILVVGGGGARGAWGAGYAKYLVTKYSHDNPNFRYKNVYGTSTGSLMAPLIILNNFTKLKTVYTTISQKTIFSVNPFKPDGSIKKIKSAWRAIRGKKTLGETYNLLNYMLDTTHGRPGLSQTEYNKIRESGRYTVAVTNMRNATVEYHCSDDNSRESMINWMWASANEPLFMTYYQTDDENGTNAYVDGGVISNVPIIKALKYARDHGIDTIDVIVNKPYDDAIGDTLFEKRDLLDGLLRLINIFSLQIRDNNIEIAKLQAHSTEAETSSKNQSDYILHPSKYIQINIYYFPPEFYFPPNDLNQKELVFDSTRMNALWNAGEHGEKDNNIKIENVFHFNKDSVDNVYREYNLHKNIR